MRRMTIIETGESVGNVRPNRASRRMAKRSGTGRYRRPVALVSGAGMALSVAQIIAPAMADAATTLEVTTTADSGAGSLRQALADSLDGDTITFASSVTGTIALDSALPVERSVTIQGPGLDQLSIDGGNAVQDLVIAPDAGIVVVSGLTLTHGHGVNGGA